MAISCPKGMQTRYFLLIHDNTKPPEDVGFATKILKVTIVAAQRCTYTFKYFTFINKYLNSFKYN